MLKPSKRFVYFTIRFILVHVITYIFIGVVFMNLQNYASAFVTMDAFANFRSLDSTIVRMAPVFQIFRGAFFAFILYPFYNTLIKSDYAWVKMFFLIWGFSLIGSVAPIPGSIEGIIYTKMSLAEHLIGIPEVTVQIFVFSWFFVKWENRTERDYS
ncbi:hypothetical protein ACTWKD_13450 [Halanaerobium saccharolyticum]|jgi:hypothetical protein|uniref:Uncharacterized protein n=1 Tax=Halanaerobium saccharolyticum TaxID=43595 RepID=A0A2T5RKY8_9FIRM|nr:MULTISPECIES: hypothetical protein [Halanaerobium]PTV99785.1 hypothetical protein C8C76_1097 [Halanaerobium saccharolyticum]PUU95406.1 MAG: hypothetical protein CI949_160 [Halanaerobium sp.]TDQ03961.1 hypothetical protein C7957_10256 [Halanaerobium saccharolyticum]